MSGAIEIKYYLGDVGTRVVVSTGEDLTTATVTTLKVRKPSGTLVDWVATVNPSDDTQMIYIVQQGDFDQTGTYKLQAYVEYPSGKWRGNTVSFKVTEIFK